MSEHIYFVDHGLTPSGRTRCWGVMAKDGKAYLGTVRWWGAWRCYAFFPEANTVYERTCLRDIATFCEERTRDQRQEVARRRGVTA